MAIEKNNALTRLLALLTAAALFLVFVAFSYSAPASPVGNVALASALTAAAAAAFAFLWPAASWRWGLWLGSAFGLYLVAAFAAFAVGGNLEWWPLLEALTICAAGCAAAAAGGALS
ncbi:MAG: hypothetical protein JXB36_03010, partial [Gammaproteobacteria bacterium]|nr:hypothetical protein [Gammaproteobacteria bacterium]